MGIFANTAPPLHTDESLSLGLVTQTLPPMSEGSRPLISSCSRSGRPGSRVFPPSGREDKTNRSRIWKTIVLQIVVQRLTKNQMLPESTMFPRKQRLRSMSVLRIDL